MNPRREAAELLGHEAAVLEPSPPAVAEDPWFADDPAREPGISPIGSGPGTWDELARRGGEVATFAASRWLGAWKRLEPAPSGLVETRLALHHVAEHVLKPAREAANGKFGLRYTRAGFGTPFFGEDRQVRVERADLVWQTAGHVDSREPLEADASFVGDWFGFAFSVLEELRSGAPDGSDTRVQIWPEHFDAAIELGAEAEGARAAYGCSPGDENHPEPYCYVAPWAAEGYEHLPYSALLESPDQRRSALEFFRARTS